MGKFKKLVEGYKQKSVSVLQNFIHADSVYDSKTVSKDAPFGKGVKNALSYIAKVGKEMGFAVDYCDGYATEISYGTKGPLIGIYAHADVVPVSGKWNFEPFGAKIVGKGKEAKMYGRGTSDDKGPGVAALFAMKLLKDNDLIKDYRVRLVFGGDEERGGSCLAHYFHEMKKPDCDYGFTPDAEFPLIYAEKAIAHANATKDIDLSPVIAMDGGVVANAVCDKLVVTLPSDEKFKNYLKESEIAADVSDLGKVMIVSFKGKSAHGSTPELGKNAAYIGWKALGTFYGIKFLENLSSVMSDPNGKGFDGYHKSKELGMTTYCVGITKYNEGKFMCTIDFRHGEDVDYVEYLDKLAKAADVEINNASHMDALLYKKDTPLVSTLMKSYKRTTHKFFDKPLAIGGGTYAKEANNTVAFGSAFKKHPGDIHSPNEYIYLDDLYKQIEIYADAINSLGNIK